MDKVMDNLSLAATGNNTRREGPPKVHNLKILETYFFDICRKIKTFEVRRWDRDFKVGDILRLRAWSQETGKFTGATVDVTVVYLLPGGQFGIQPGYCVLGIVALW